MPFQISVEKGYVLVTITGDWMTAEAKDAQSDAAMAVQSSGIARVLLDVTRAQINWDTFDVFNLTTLMTRTFPVGTKHAFVTAPMGKESSSARFAETVGVNRGAHMRHFVDIDVAKKWLLGDPSPGS